MNNVANFSGLQVETVSADNIGYAVFHDLKGSPYHIEDDGRVNAGISFLYAGGKFSCPMDPTAGRQLAELANRGNIAFSRVDLAVRPATVGRDKSPAIKGFHVVRLYQAGKLVYHDTSCPVQLPEDGSKTDPKTERKAS